MRKIWKIYSLRLIRVTNQKNGKKLCLLYGIMMVECQMVRPFIRWLAYVDVDKAFFPFRYACAEPFIHRRRRGGWITGREEKSRSKQGHAHYALRVRWHSDEHYFFPFCLFFSVAMCAIPFRSMQCLFRVSAFRRGIKQRHRNEIKTKIYYIMRINYYQGVWCVFDQLNICGIDLVERECCIVHVRV